MRLFLLTVLVTGLCPNMALSQELSRQDFEDFCKVMQGRWQGEMTPVEDESAFGKRGETQTAFAIASVDEDGNALTVKLYGGEGTGTWLLAYDAREKKIKTMWINSSGDIDQALILRDGDQWIEKGVGSTLKGEKIEFENRLTVADDGNQHTWTGTSSRGGSPNEPRHDVWKRVSGKVAAADGSEDFQDFAKMVTGRWKGDIVYIHDWEGEEQGKGARVTGYADFRVARDGHAVVATDFAGSGTATHIFVWDASLGKIVVTGSGADGFSATSIVDRKSERSWKFLPISGGNVHGETLGGSATLTFSDDGKSYRWSGTLTLAGKPLDELQDVYQRVD